MRAVVGGAVASLAIACVQPAADAGDAREPAAQTPGPPGCREPTAGDPLARFGGGDCGFELVEAGPGVALRSLDLEPTPVAVGSIPEPCTRRPCTFEGQPTELGPVVVVRVTGVDGELPAGVWLGIAASDVLVFVDLWEGAGVDVWSERTPAGPSHTLAPHRCGAALGLLALARTTAGEAIEPPAALRDREGIYEIVAGAPKRTEDPPAGCVPLAVPLP
jgi:hypothetical protein